MSIDRSKPENKWAIGGWEWLHFICSLIGGFVVFIGIPVWLLGRAWSWAVATCFGAG